MERLQPQFDCILCGKRGHQLADCQRRLGILNNSNQHSTIQMTNTSTPMRSGIKILRPTTFPGTVILHSQVRLRRTCSATPAMRRDNHPFSIQPKQTTQHFQCTPLLAPAVKTWNDSIAALNPLYRE